MDARMVFLPFVVSVRVRRKSSNRVSIRLTTEPVASPEATRLLTIAIEPELAVRLPDGVYVIERTPRFGSRMRSFSPDVGEDTDALEELVRVLVGPMDELLRSLVQMMENLPTDEHALDLAREVFATHLAVMVTDGSLAESVRPGFCELIPCTAPSGIEAAMRCAAENDLARGEMLLQVSGVQAAIIRDGTKTRVYLAVVSGRSPFRATYLALMRAALVRVQGRAEQMEVSFICNALVGEARRLGACVDALVAAFGGPESSVADAPQNAPPVTPALWNTGKPGEA